MRKILNRKILAAAICIVLLSGCEKKYSVDKTPDTGAQADMNEEQSATLESKQPEVLQPLEGELPELAREMTAACVVRLDISGSDTEYYGSGLLWDVTEEHLILVTAGHLLGEGSVECITFSDGAVLYPQMAGGQAAFDPECRISGSQDVGFVEIPLRVLRDIQFGELGGALSGGVGSASAGTLKTAQSGELAVVSLHQRTFDTVDEFSALHLTASSENGAADISLEASLEEKSIYQPELDSEVMMLSCPAEAGMSGGGVFDGYGNLIGMVIGGNGAETAVLSMENLNSAYEELYGIRRNTEDYGEK